MNFVFGALIIVALVTGKAYFRGVYARDENPRRYWTIVGCYAVLIVSGMVLPLAGSAHREKDDGTSTGSHFGCHSIFSPTRRRGSPANSMAALPEPVAHPMAARQLCIGPRRRRKAAPRTIALN